MVAVGVDGYGHVGQAASLHEASHQRVLVAAVAREPGSPGAGRLAGEGADDLPGAVFGAVVHVEDEAVLGAEALGHEVLELLVEERSRDGQHRLLVVAGHNDGKRGGLPPLAGLGRLGEGSAGWFP